jgi:hypothetical protein
MVVSLDRVQEVFKAFNAYLRVFIQKDVFYWVVFSSDQVGQELTALACQLIA